MTSWGILPKIECLQWSLDQSWHSTRYVLLSVLYTSWFCSTDVCTSTSGRFDRHWPHEPLTSFGCFTLLSGPPYYLFHLLLMEHRWKFTVVGCRVFSPFLTVVPELSQVLACVSLGHPDFLFSVLIEIWVPGSKKMEMNFLKEVYFNFFWENHLISCFVGLSLTPVCINLEPFSLLLF